jgi:hypothetical protein
MIIVLLGRSFLGLGLHGLQVCVNCLDSILIQLSILRGLTKPSQIIQELFDTRDHS